MMYWPQALTHMNISPMKPIICVPMGDPAGIGPEIIVKSLTESDLFTRCKILVIGSESFLKRAAEVCNRPVTIHKMSCSSHLSLVPGAINLLNRPLADAGKIKPGEISAAAGKASYQFIKEAVILAMSKKVDALATTPINKESLKAAGIPHIGHTEMLAELTGSHDPLTLFQVKKLRVFFLSRHLSLREACNAVTEERVYNYITRSINTLKSLGITSPRLAVAGLNPHCGEHGLFGDEEDTAIVPAVNRASSKGLQVCGPLPADSVFYQALSGKFDAVLSLYHDQGHIATKMVDFERTISITCGLPFLRTSVDHGTAHDIAGTGTASPVSMTEAIRLAAVYTNKIRKLKQP